VRGEKIKLGDDRMRQAAAVVLAMGMFGPAAALAQPAPVSFAGATVNLVVGYTSRRRP
jgi:hypothetical protein